MAITAAARKLEVLFTNCRCDLMDQPEMLAQAGPVVAPIRCSRCAQELRLRFGLTEPSGKKTHLLFECDNCECLEWLTEPLIGVFGTADS
jgi:hypothetical protein